eukprot:6285415-Amphidinium_carterae.1
MHPVSLPLRRNGMSWFCANYMQRPLRRTAWIGHFSQPHTQRLNFTLPAEAEYPFVDTRRWAVLLDLCCCLPAEAVFSQGLIAFKYWSSISPLSCCIQGQVRLDLARRSFSAHQPPPLHLQVPSIALLHDHRSAHVSALHLPAVAVGITLQGTSLLVRYYGRLALCAQDLAADSRLLPFVPLLCPLRSYHSHLAEPLRPTLPVHFCTSRFLRSYWIDCFATN